MAIEWTMAFDHPRTGERRLDRGAEFLVFRDGRICEVRAYYHGGVPANLSGDLVGFDHPGRGHTRCERAAREGAPRGRGARRPIPPFTQEHEDFREGVRRFVERELRPHAREWEDARWFPNEVFERCAELGYLGLKYEEEYGGEGGGYVADAVFAEELALRLGRPGRRHRGAHVDRHPAGLEVRHRGPEAALPRARDPRREDRRARGSPSPTRAPTSPGIRTMARRVDGGYVVNGSKMFITNGVRADFIVTAVKTTAEGGHHGISFLIIDRGEGVESSKIEKLGWHASDTALIAFDDVFVPEENLLGEENEGFYLIMANFQWERLLMALGRWARCRRCSSARWPTPRSARPSAGRSARTR